MSRARSRASALVMALALDLALGELANRYHPVAWLGQLIGWLERRAPATAGCPALAYGSTLTVVVVGSSALLGFFIERLLERVPIAELRLSLEAIALKPALSLRGLVEAAHVVESALAAEKLDNARARLGALVSRPTDSLARSLVISATIESLAENLPDSLLAPLLYYVVGGLPAAYAYRAANTMDAMIGYRNQRYELLGKAAARLDDLLNFVPARLSAVVVVLAAGARWRDARDALIGERRRTASPNAGWPMSAAAGALGVRLEKPGHYQLGDGGRDPAPLDIQRAIRLAMLASAIGCGVLTTVLVLIGKSAVRGIGTSGRD